MENYLYIALFAPLVGSLIAALFGNTPKKLSIGLLTSTLLGVSLIASLIYYFMYFQKGTVFMLS